MISNSSEQFCATCFRTSRLVAAVGMHAVLLLLHPTLAGCRGPGEIQYSGQLRHVIVLPGILGHTPGLDRIRKAVESEIPEASAQVWNWTRIEPHWLPNPIGHIREYDKNRRRAALLAGHIAEFRREHPDVRLSIIGLSGGTAIALFACEELPPEVTLDRIILLSAAVSPEYDLRPALRRAENGIVSYYSRGDWLVLKRGTSRFGTGDRVYGPSAGYSGFDEPESCGDSCEKLTQIAWHADLARLYANSGGHAGGQERDFLRHCVMKWLEGDVSACAGPKDAADH